MPDVDWQIFSAPGARKSWRTKSYFAMPDVDWQIAEDVVEDQPGVWRVTPPRPLPMGEYGIWGKTDNLLDFGTD